MEERYRDLAATSATPSSIVTFQFEDVKQHSAPSSLKKGGDNGEMRKFEKGLTKFPYIFRG
jgi:hypothetical protein